MLFRSFFFERRFPFWPKGTVEAAVSPCSSSEWDDEFVQVTCPNGKEKAGSAVLVSFGRFLRIPVMLFLLAFQLQDKSANWNVGLLYGRVSHHDCRIIQRMDFVNPGAGHVVRKKVDTPKSGFY